MSKRNDNGYIVYKHTSPSNKIYIGITYLKPEHRWGRNGNGYKGNNYFYKAIQKYGWDNITHEILFDGLTKEEAEQKEIELIAYYKSNQRNYGYNIANGGKCVGSCSEETKRKLAEANKGKHHTEETKVKMSKSGKGRLFSEEHKQKISKALKGKRRPSICGDKHPMYGKHLSEDTKNKLSQSLKGKTHSVSEEHKLKLRKIKSKPVLQYDINGNFIARYNSIKEASAINKIDRGLIIKCCKGRIQSAGGYIWRYAEDSVDLGIDYL